MACLEGTDARRSGLRIDRTRNEKDSEGGEDDVEEDERASGAPNQSVEGDVKKSTSGVYTTSTLPL